MQRLSLALTLSLSLLLTLLVCCAPSCAEAPAVHAGTRAAATLEVGMHRRRVIEALGRPAETLRLADGSLAEFEAEGGDSLVVAFDLRGRVAAWMTGEEFEDFAALQAAQAVAQAQGLAGMGYGQGAALGYARGLGNGAGARSGELGSLAGAFDVDPTIDYGDSTNPDSWAFDAYEYDSQGWSGGAYDNPSSSYYDGGGYDASSTPSFDSFGY